MIYDLNYDITTIDFNGKSHKVKAVSVGKNLCIYGITIKNNKVLIAPAFGGYIWPGGTIKTGEDHLEGLKREYKEETGYDIEPIELMNIYTSMFWDPIINKDFHTLMIFYYVKIIGGNESDVSLNQFEKEFQGKAKWTSIDELEKMHYSCGLGISDEIITAVKNKLKEGR
ncbi:NUDIX domain-containing protein [Candidatus Saccharibacteria bacterium]|nr:NUDIX domain-containing protein [Candidatus Saccharibacteria bacterium]